MRLLLDTAVLIHAVQSPDHLGRRVKALLLNQDTDLDLSTISLTEIAIKNAKGTLKLSAEVARRAVENLSIRILPYTAEHAFYLFELPLHHRDPFDRQIIAQAMAENIPVATSDDKFRLYEGLTIIW